MSHHPISPRVRAWLEGPMLEVEGGYKPAERPDTETLFGTTIAQWKRAIPAWVRENGDAMAGLPPEIRARFTRIEAAARADDGTTLNRETSDLLRYIGRQLEPMGAGEQPDSGLPRHSYARPGAGVSANGQREIRAVLEVAFQNYNDRFIVGAGFDRWPDFMQEHGMDFAIHGGPPRARWAAVKALYEANVINEQEYRSFPLITTDQANGKYTFTSTKPKGWPDDGEPGDGQFYSTSEASERLIGFMQRIDPYDQTTKQFVWDRFKVWRATYNDRLVENVPALAQYANGFDNRLQRLHRPGAEGANETVYYHFPAQYRDGFLLWDDKVAINIDAVGPDGRAHPRTVEYTVDRASAAFVALSGELPPGIELVQPGAKDARGNINRQNVPALAWQNDESITDDATGRPAPSYRSIMVALTPGIHQWLRDAAVQPGVIYNSVPMGDFARGADGRLDDKQSDWLALIADARSGLARMQVVDVHNAVPTPPGTARMWVGPVDDQAQLSQAAPAPRGNSR
ncbi:MAG: hypothetical protein DI582_08300 [Azospirillum brasilense]|nr:MAG: hypothetical protein DI582_08300 [Azospirillum brasilense]